MVWAWLHKTPRAPGFRRNGSGCCIRCIPLEWSGTAIEYPGVRSECRLSTAKYTTNTRAPRCGAYAHAAFPARAQLGSSVTGACHARVGAAVGPSVVGAAELGVVVVGAVVLHLQTAPFQPIGPSHANDGAARSELRSGVRKFVRVCRVRGSVCVPTCVFVGGSAHGRVTLCHICVKFGAAKTS